MCSYQVGSCFGGTYNLKVKAYRYRNESYCVKCGIPLTNAERLICIFCKEKEAEKSEA